jgi:hypothetical protein
MVSVDDPANVSDNGSSWGAKVTYPSGYTSDPSEKGWNYTQLVKTHRTRVNNGVNQLRSMNDDAHILDSTFGYDPVDPNLYPTGKEIVYGDSPNEPLLGTMSSLSVNDNFTLYVLFKPIGSGSRYVPLHNWTWYWKVDLNKVGGDWTPVAGSFGMGKTDGTDFPDHPTWHDNIANCVWIP